MRVRWTKRHMAADLPLDAQHVCPRHRLELSRQHAPPWAAAPSSRYGPTRLGRPWACGCDDVDTR